MQHGIELVSTGNNWCQLVPGGNKLVLVNNSCNWFHLAAGPSYNSIGHQPELRPVQLEAVGSVILEATGPGCALTEIAASCSDCKKKRENYNVYNAAKLYLSKEVLSKSFLCLAHESVPNCWPSNC